MSRVLFFLAMLTSITISGRAELWQSSQWALLGDVTLASGYDSNLSLSQDGTGSAFISAEPGLVLKRVSSSTRLELTGRATALNYLAPGQGSYIDPYFSIVYEYPSSEEALPRYTGNFYWDRNTSGNARVSELLTSTSTHADFGGRIFSTDKMGFDAQLFYDAISYQDSQFVGNQRATLSLGAAYQPDTLSEYSLSLLSGDGRQDPTSAEAGAVKHREEGLVGRVRGQITPKISGEMYAGAASVHYTGAYNRNDTLPLGGGKLGWQVTARGLVSTGIDFGVDYSPDGESLEIRNITVSYQQSFYDVWKAEIWVAPGRTNFFLNTEVRTDRYVGTGAAMNYEPSKRFSVRVSYEFTHQDSTLPIANFDHHLVSARLTCHL